jgi:hypothetical protein
MIPVPRGCQSRYFRLSRESAGTVNIVLADCGGGRELYYEGAAHPGDVSSFNGKMARASGSRGRTHPDGEKVTTVEVSRWRNSSRYCNAILMIHMFKILWSIQDLLTLSIVHSPDQPHALTKRQDALPILHHLSLALKKHLGSNPVISFLHSPSDMLLTTSSLRSPAQLMKLVLSNPLPHSSRTTNTPSHHLQLVINELGTTPLLMRDHIDLRLHLRFLDEFAICTHSAGCKGGGELVGD